MPQVAMHRALERAFFLLATPMLAMGGITNQFPRGLEEADVIIAGGGTVGLVVASRLSDADPSLSILVVESGQDSTNDPTVINPLYFLENILSLPEPNPRMKYYQGLSEPNINGRAMTVPVGNVLGGGSAINMLTYTRAQREDMDGWNMAGWSADDMLPYMKKFETYHGPGFPETHGYDGPIQVSNGSYGPTRLQDQFLQAAAKVGYSEKIDLQNLDSNQGLQRNLRYISEDGIRQDSAHAYLHPRLQDGAHPNLQVIVEHEVLRVITENNKAVGIELRASPEFQNSTTIHTVKAKKLVIVSAGTVGTPLLLERSGIGGQERLEKAGINVVSDVPGVGEQFHDHNTLVVTYYSSLLPNETYDGILNGQVTFEELMAKKSKMLGWNSAEITSKVRPTDEEISNFLKGDALSVWERDFQNNPNLPIATISTANGYLTTIPESGQNQTFFSTGNFLLYPYAHGHVHVTGPRIEDDLDIITGILTDPEGFDLAMATWLYKKQREIVRRLDSYRGEVPDFHPAFDASSDAVAKKRDGPLPSDVKDIVYTDADEAVLLEWVRNTLAQNWHGTGTCRMAPIEEGGVVDEKLSVYGVESLKIADLSVVPINVAANTANMAFTIGEKVSVLFDSEIHAGQ